MKRTGIEGMLPGVFQRTLRPGGPLDALLDVMEELHAPAEEALARLDATLDPRRTPDEFVPYLASWVDLYDIFEKTALQTSRPPISSGLARLRELASAAAYLSKWRGTRKGLLLYLETATGLGGFSVDEQVVDQGQIRPFHLRIRAPEESRPYRALIMRIIEVEKPVYVTYELEFGNVEAAADG